VGTKQGVDEVYQGFLGEAAYDLFERAVENVLVVRGFRHGSMLQKIAVPA
jgi:hypothetical protein